MTVGIGIISTVAPGRSNCPLVTIIRFDVLLLNVPVLAVCASAVVGHIQTDEFLEGIRTEPSPITNTKKNNVSIRPMTILTIATATSL